MSFEPKKIVGYGIVAILLGILAVQYVVALPAVARDDQASACRALSPMPFNPVLGRLPAPAPEFTAQDVSGQMATLSAYRGKVVFLNFWQTACPPCKEEMPAMERLIEQVGSDEFEVIAVSSDTSWSPVRTFFPKGTSMTVLLDPPPENEVMGKIAKQYGTEKWP